MKQLLLVIALLFCALLPQAQKPYNVVFDLTSKDTSDQKSVIRWIKAITANDANAQLEVVLYGQSLDMVTKDKSSVTEDVQQLTANRNVSFKVCEAAMKRYNLAKSDLLAGVQTVPDGIYEIITKQGQGWGYIKAAR